MWEATLLHAFLAHSSELEDNRITARGDPIGGASWDITVIPPHFSLVEKLRFSGKSLLEALALGLEVHSRTTLFSAEQRGSVFVPGAAGPAVAAAKAMGLRVKDITRALGLATSNFSLSHLNFGNDVHCFKSALHSLQAIIAAEMAKEGMSGNSKMIMCIFPIWW